MKILESFVMSSERSSEGIIRRYYNENSWFIFTRKIYDSSAEKSSYAEAREMDKPFTI